MKINKKIKLAMFFLMGVILFSSFAMAYYSSISNYVQYGPYDRIDTFDLNALITDRRCEAGQDFILQISPLGCEPAIVRSDLLEEQNVFVYCPISATVLNPLIEVEAIRTMSITGQYPKEVATVGFHPSEAALNPYQKELTQPVFFDNIGYAVIVLRKQPNESAMPNYVEGNLSARIRYDITSAFGVGQTQFYLPILTEDQWEQKFNQFSFWDGRGYLRATAVRSDSATISIYSDRSRSGILGQGDQKILYSTINLNEGEKSQEIYIPGFDSCFATMQLKLDGVENPDTRARLRVNGNPVEVTNGEDFLNGECTIKGLPEKVGLNSEVKFTCKEDRDGFHSGTINLRITPKIALTIDREEKNVEVGDYLFSHDGKKVFLAYANTIGETNKQQDLYVFLMTIPDHPSNKLTLEEMRAAKTIAELDIVQGNLNSGITMSLIGEYAQKVLGTGDKLLRAIIDGEKFSFIRYGNLNTEFDKEILVSGFSSQENVVLSDDIEEIFDLAIEDYRELMNVYPDEKISNVEGNLGEQALYDLIFLADKLGQKATLVELCHEFKGTYPNSRKSLEICTNQIKLSSSTPFVTEVLIDDRIYQISFEGVYEPSRYEYSARVRVEHSDWDESQIYTLTKNNVVYVDPSDNEYIMLEGLEEDFAKLKLNIRTKTEIGNIPKSESVKIYLNQPESFSSDYTLTLLEVNLEKVAKVSLIPNINYAGTNASFNFRINIDKRAIKLSPEKTQEKIDKLDGLIGKWGKVSNAMEKLLKRMNQACLATSAVLIIKNYFLNAQGKGVARQAVMNSDNGWYEYCGQLVRDGIAGPNGQTYSSEEECLFENSDYIAEDVNAYQYFLANQKNDLNEIKADYTTSGGIFSEDITNLKAVNKKYSEDVKENLEALENNYQLGGSFADPLKENGETINLETLKSDVLTSSGFDDRLYSFEQLEQIDLYSRMLNNQQTPDRIKQIANESLYNIFLDIQVNSRDKLLEKTALQELNDKLNLKDVGITSYYSNKDREEKEYEGGVNTEGSGIPTNIIPVGTPIQYLNFAGIGTYVLTLKNVDGEHYEITGVYSETGVSIDDENIVKEIKKNIEFVKYNEKSYQNRYENPEIRYYETGSYKRYPALVAFDLQNGWYAEVRDIGGESAYDESGRVNAFYLCNVGRNGMQDDIYTDICESYIEGITPMFSGLSSTASDGLVQKAKEAINIAQRRYSAGIREVRINNQRIPVGNPAAEIPGMKCQDFMSPKDCNILFNLCDPVVCPSSRCNMGGNYYVSDVVQTGIIGSIALCFPNYKEGIVVPVCLTGIKAGLDGWLSILESYRACLQESLDTGQTVGICDEIQSVYFCEFFYSQIIPVAKYGIPKLTELILEKRSGSRGGGEYFNVRDAWQRAQSSLSYYTQFYAKNAYEAFKIRSVEQAGQDIACDFFLSVNYPNGGNLLDALTTPASPVQFYAKFDERPYTTVTNPPQSMYSVFYHIYAGEDRGAFYRIYFKRDATTSFYQNSPYRIDIATGYVAKGDAHSEKKDFVAPSGYKELCVMVNEQEECGFSQISTNFALNYISDMYAASQANQTQITTEKECIAGTSSWYSLLNSNVQSGVEDALDPQIYNQGIIRTCATYNPGTGTNPDAWVEVGYCGNSNLKCWLNTESVKNVIDVQSIEDDVLGSLNTVQDLLDSDGYASREAIDDKIKEVKEKSSDTEKISIINEIFEQVFYNDQKATLIYLRAGSYGRIAKVLFDEYMKEIETQVQQQEKLEDCPETAYEKICLNNEDCGPCCEGSKLVEKGVCLQVVSTGSQYCDYSFYEAKETKGYCGVPLDTGECENVGESYCIDEDSYRVCTEDLEWKTAYCVGSKMKCYDVNGVAKCLEENEYTEFLEYYENQKASVGWDSVEDAAQYDWSNAEVNVIQNADECSDCGGESALTQWLNLNKCDVRECLAIGLQIGKECVYYNGMCREFTEENLEEMFGVEFENVGEENEEYGQMLSVLGEQRESLSETYGWNTWNDVDEGEFSSAERRVFSSAEECSDCGGSALFGIFNSCDSIECIVLGFKLGKDCVYYNGECEEVVIGEGFVCDNSEIGQNVLDIALNKRGQDTVRLAAGREVLDNTCATFVSNVLIEAGTLLNTFGLIPDISTTPNRDAVEELPSIFRSERFIEIEKEDWEEDLKPGDVLLFGRGEDEFAHSGIWSHYGPYYHYINDPGTSGLIKESYIRSLEKTNDYDLYVTHVWRPRC